MLQVSAKMLKYPEQNGYLQPPVRVWINNTSLFYLSLFLRILKKNRVPETEDSSTFKSRNLMVEISSLKKQIR